MTATQSLKIYEILVRHFKDESDARIVVGEIKQIVEEKVETETKKICSAK
jgi:hypothetical protein